MSEVYAIVDLDGYVSQMREAAAKSISPDNTDNLDNYISLTQMTNLVTEFCLGYDDENRPLLDEDTNEKIFEETAVWIHNIGLAKLAAQDLIQCAWDDKLNEMVFWNSTQEKNNDGKKNKRRKNKKTPRPDSGL